VIFQIPETLEALEIVPFYIPSRHFDESTEKAFRK
jgi:hypothetical protein